MFYSWVLLLGYPLKMTLVWINGYNVTVCVRFGKETMLSGANIYPTLNGKWGVFLYPKHVLSFCDSNRDSGAGSNHYFYVHGPECSRFLAYLGCCH